MFIRETIKKDKNTKKIYRSYQLVEAYRTDRGPRQRILLTIGCNQAFSKEDRKLLANRIEELASGIQSFLTYPNHIDNLAQTFARQLTENISIKNSNNKHEEHQPWMLQQKRT